MIEIKERKMIENLKPPFFLVYMGSDYVAGSRL